MITNADVDKLLGIRATEPSVLSLYLQVAQNPPALRDLPARAGKLLALSAGGTDDPDAVTAQDAARKTARRLLEIHARQWLGRTVAIFACDEPHLAEAVALPCAVEDRAVFATRPHVRPLLLALQRSPGYYAVILDPQYAWVFRVAGERIDKMILRVAENVHSPGFGGWYDMDARHVTEPVTQLARHHHGETAKVLGRLLHSAGPEPVVIGGQLESVPAFLGMLPDGIGDHFAGSFAADTTMLTPSRVRDLADPVVERSISTREWRLVAQLDEPPRELAATGLQACLAAVNQRAVRLLLVPETGLLPGFACQRCSTLSTTGTDCPDWGAASLAVPDLIEEMAVTALGDGAQVTAVADPPGGVAALLRFPVQAGGDLGEGRGDPAPDRG